MSWSLPIDSSWVWLLASTRMLALFTFAPVFGHTAVPARLRIALGALLAWNVAPEAEGIDPLVMDNLTVAGAVAREVVLGATFGFAAGLVFAGFGLLGEFISVQGGLGAARVLDPTTGASSVALASMLQLFTLMVFLAIDGHHTLLQAAALSFERLPVGGPMLGAASLGGLASLGASIFEIAVRLAAPVTVAMMVTNLALGILGRMMPQLNLMTVQLPAHVAMTLLIIALGAAPLLDASARELTGFLDEAMTLILEGG